MVLQALHKHQLLQPLMGQRGRGATGLSYPSWRPHWGKYISLTRNTPLGKSLALEQPLEVIWGLKQDCAQGMHLSVCLGRLFRQKEACQLCGLETIAVASRPTLCTLFGPHKNVLHIFKHHRGKMIWHRGQENTVGAGRDGINSVFYFITNS